jgi:hypothetical protein
MSTGTRFFGLLLAIALLIGAVIADWYLIRRALAQYASGAGWQQTTGTIVTTTVTSRKTKGGRRYRATVTYEYQAAGETRTGSTIVVDESEGPSFRSESAARSAFPQGGSVPVYVDPADPTNAALVVGLQKKTIALLYFAGVLNAFALTMLRPSIRSFGVRREPICYYLIEDDASRAVLRVRRDVDRPGECRCGAWRAVAAVVGADGVDRPSGPRGRWRAGFPLAICGAPRGAI